MSLELSFSPCPFCNSENRIAARFCKKCGKSVLKDKPETPAVEEECVNCPRCEKSVKTSAKFCSKCGFNLLKYNLAESVKEIVYSAPITAELSETKALQAKYIHDAIFFVSNLKDYYGIEIDELYGMLECQKKVFQENEKGLAFINMETGEIIAVNSRFEEFTGYSGKELKRKNISSFLSELNPCNKKYDFKTILGKAEFFVFNRDFKKLSLKIEKKKEDCNDKFVILTLDDSASAESRWLKKDRASTTKKLFLVARIVEEINSSLELDLILDNTLERVIDATRSDAAVIMFVDENKLLYPIADRGMSEDLIDFLKKKPVKVDKSTSASKALLSGKTVESKVSGTKTGLTGALLLKENLTSIVTVPLKSKEEIIGIMSLGRRKKKEYSGKDLELLDAIGNHIVIAIKNARLYEQVKTQLKELGEKNDKLLRLEKMKDNLTRMIVHDLKSPITGIMAYASHFNDDKNLGEQKLKKIFNSIYSASQDILKMVMNLLDIGKMEEGKFYLNFSRINSEELIDKVIEELELKILRKNLEIVTVNPESLPPVDADESLLYRVLINLVDNAIKYTRAEKKIEIGVEDNKKKKEMFFYIADEGKGIPEKYHEKVFEPFFTMDTAGTGITTSTGIGLAFCKLAIEAHGGKIWVENNSPQGSRFCFTLPLYKESEN